MRRIAFLVVTGVAVLAVTAPPAAAHVTVHSDEAVQGASAEIAFRVPTESATASTVKLKVAFPADHLVENVSVRSHPGWTYTVTTAPIQPAVQHTGHDHSAGATQAVSEIEWTAGPGAAIKPGEYDEFRISAGPLPDTDKLVFKALQTYDSGEVVRWIDLPADQEPEHPAPVLTIAVTKAATQAAVSTPSATTPLAWWAVGVAGVALLLAIGAVVLSMRGRSGDRELT
jgi:uncharacterized protein YcnI